MPLDSSEDEDGAASKPDLTREGMADKDKRKYLRRLKMGQALRSL